MIKIIIKTTKKNNKKKIDINNTDSDDIFENKLTSKVSKIRKKVQATKNITSNELEMCSKNEIFIESVHIFVLEYKGNYHNEYMIKDLPKKDEHLNLILILFKKRIKKTYSTTKILFIYLKKNDIELKFQRLYFYNEFKCAMNQRNINTKSTYSITNKLVSESKKHVISSHLNGENNNETELL